MVCVLQKEQDNTEMEEEEEGDILEDRGSRTMFCGQNVQTEVREKNSWSGIN